MRQVFILFLLLFISLGVQAQWISINNTGANPHASAALDITSDSKGILIPRMTQLEREAIPTPAPGLLVFQTDADTGFYYVKGTAWKKLNDETSTNAIAENLTAADTALWNNALTAETDPSIPIGTQIGEMQYWNGSAWVTVAAAANDSATLQFIGGIPTWVGGVTPIPNVKNPITGKFWMDRNLGATQIATSSTDVLAYGDLYQWGRNSDGHESRTSSTTTTLSLSDTPGHGDFILSSAAPNDWRSPQNDNLWQGVDGINNPCPSGYRLPTNAEWVAEKNSWASANSAGAYGSVLKLPLAGDRLGSSGSLFDEGSFGLYWSSTIASTGAYYLFFGNSSADTYSATRADAFSVRCIKN